MTFSSKFISLGVNFVEIEIYSLYLNEVRTNLAANLDRSPLIHSYGYVSAGDRSTLFAIFSLGFVPFTKYAVLAHD